MNITGIVKFESLNFEVDLLLQNSKLETIDSTESATLDDKYKKGFSDGNKKTTDILTNSIIEFINANKDKSLQEVATDLITHIKYFKIDE